MTKSIMEHLAIQAPYPAGHMGLRIGTYDRRFNSLFDGQLRLLFIVPSDHVTPDGTIDHNQLETDVRALLAFDGGDTLHNERVEKIARQLGRNILQGSGGKAFDADHLIPELEDDHSYKGIIYPGTRNFRSGRLLASYSGEPAYEGQVFDTPLSEPHLHLDRVNFHEMGHRILHFMDDKDHPMLDALDYPELDVIDEKHHSAYESFRHENFADGFMALMMVREHGKVGHDYAKVIGHARGLGFENGIHEYYTTKTVEAALELAKEYGDNLKDAPVEELAIALYHRQHEVMWSPQEFVGRCAEQTEYDQKATAGNLSPEEEEKFQWLDDMRTAHEDALFEAIRHKEAFPDTPEREALVADYLNERRCELDYIWQDNAQKRAALYQEKCALREGAYAPLVTFEEGSDLEDVLLDTQEKIAVINQLEHEYPLEAAPALGVQISRETY